MGTAEHHRPNKREGCMDTNELLARTTYHGTVTHVRINGEVVAVRDMSDRFGFSYDQWALMRTELTREPANDFNTHCVLGGVALTANAFEAGHNIQLGDVH
ncbi:MAG TPA: hypothetical protein VLF87_00095 [Patescibacteria group bacterium]|nr:hypothetical protein [Patescibacteria group bacterium]